jgi:hypothetical protein
MTILPIRNLGDIGILSDKNSYDLPLNALSSGNNLRFTNGSIYRSPAFKGVVTPSATTPSLAYTYAIPGNRDKVGIVNNNGTSYFFDGTTETDVTPTVFTPVVSNVPFTHTILGNVSYINRSTDVPQFFLPTSTKYTKLTNWPVTYKCRALRAYKSYLIALDITKGSARNPALVKWSDIALVDSIPVSWDETDPTKSAGENQISDLSTPLLDGLSLRDSFILYAGDEVHAMDYTAGQDVFRFRKLFDGYGIINTNCVVEVDGVHYVFGKKDIYAHDGVSPRSIISGTNLKKVYSSLVNDKSDMFFVTKDELRTEIHFCYLSLDADASFTGTSACNREAVFNYSNGTWAFRDLPNAISATNANLLFDTSTWTTLSGTWDTVGSTWADFEDSGTLGLFFLTQAHTAQSLTTSKLYVYDEFSNGSFGQPITVEANKTAFAQRIGIDLDEVGEQIRAYKVIKAIYPQAISLGSTANIQFSFGASEYDALEPTMGPLVTFDPRTNHKVDTRVGGRYLSWRLQDSSLSSFQLSGFDVDIQTTGRR